jgi:LysM repeat protein
MIAGSLRYIVLLTVLVLLTDDGFPQTGEYPVHRSEDKIILEGKIYTIHIVAEKETLYGISRAYNVTQKVIASENPDVFAGLQPGMVLKIPAEPVVDESLQIRDTDEFFFHVLKEGETLYFLSKKYGIDVGEIERANPEVTVSNLQINQVIKIPKRKTPPAEMDFPAEDFVYHHVQAGETLYSLSVLYDVSVGEIKEINPDLRWGDLKSGEYIRIPRRPKITEDTRDEESVDGMKEDLSFTGDETSIDSLARHVFGRGGEGISPDSLPEAVERPGIPFWSTLRMRRIRPEPIERPLRIAMLLPLDLHWDETSDSLEILNGDEELMAEEEDEEEKNIVNPRIIGYLEFYEGALLAIDSLRKQGIKVHLYTYDTERNRDRTREILAKPELQGADLIIGPVNYWNLEIVSEFSRKHEIPLVSPFYSGKNLVYYNPFIFQLTPSYEVEFRAWAEYLSDFNDKTMILVHSGDTREYQRIRFLKNELFRRISRKSDLDDLVFKEVVMNDSVYVDMAQVLNMEQDNLVIVPSDNEAYVSNVISPLFYQLGDYDIQVSGMPQWNRFRNIDLIYFHNLNISYYTSFYMDFSKPEMKRFIEKFYRIYRTEPYRVSPRGYNLSIYGYDLLFTFSKALDEYGRNLVYFGEEIENDPILGPYRFKRISDYGGHINTYIGIIRYDPQLNVRKLEMDEPVIGRDRRFSSRSSFR